MIVGDTSLADRKFRAGQRMILGLAGTAVDDDLRLLVREIQPAGFILFARNVAEPVQVLELNRELSSLINPENPAFLGVDQEGGRVQRVRQPATLWPPMRTVGRSEASTAELAKHLAQEVRAMGFNLNFAPVADVDSNPDNPVIGDRAFGRNPQQVAAEVATFVEAHQSEHVIAVAKHFPGHGDTSTDSHHELPIVEKSPDELRAVELVPFAKAVASDVGGVMSSHVVFPEWDETWPATLSPLIIPQILRKEMGFCGVVFSDDMEMKAVQGRHPTETLIRQATLATVDILLFCRDPELQIQAFRHLVQLQEAEPFLEREFKDAVRRIHTLRERFFLNCPPPPGLEVVGCAEHRLLASMLVEQQREVEA
ncbi:MAG: beta-N-acetylhexosaminidase [Proteobacteria bacterium]|jgi:beta-N-acetylhexosaminidase|nr:beta-N-acetylhexosaminidase [Pseudomonadota bacterium]